MKYILLTKNQYAIVDDDDFIELDKYKWVFSDGYAYRRAKKNDKEKTQSKIWMHRVINKTPEGFATDHINGNSLDNRKLNLRTVTHSENMKNSKRRKDASSNYKGIYKEKTCNRWKAMIRSNGKRFYLGLFSSAELAAKAYNDAAIRLHGIYARLNDIKEAKVI